MTLADDIDGLDRATLEEVVECIEETVEDVRFAYVFGSVVRGDHREESDLDVAVEVGEGLEGDERFLLAGRLEQIVGRPVDVVDLAGAGPVVRMQVLKEGRVLSCRDDRALAEFEMYTPSRYEDWKLLSRPFEEALSRQLES